MSDSGITPCGYGWLEPTFIEGIGPPLEQIEKDAKNILNGTWKGVGRDVVALIAEVKRLRREIEAEREAA